MLFKRKVEEIVAENPVLDPVHIISFTGVERFDFPFFLSKILEQRYTDEGYRNVLLIDNSDSKSLFNLTNSELNEVALNRITFMKDVDYDEDLVSKYSFVIFFHGLDVDTTILNKSDLVILMTDYMANTHKTLSNVFEGYEEDIYIIYRDWVGKKIKEQTIEDTINIPAAQVAMRSIIKANVSDMNIEMMLSHNGNQKLDSGLSDLFMETLRFMTEKITGADEKTVDKLFKKAR